MPLPLRRAMQLGSGAEVGAVSFADFDLNRFVRFLILLVKTRDCSAVPAGTKSITLVYWTFGSFTKETVLLFGPCAARANAEPEVLFAQVPSCFPSFSKL
jgi:hypothetical protein